jgi:DNA-binding response OmpR family regulator
LRWEARRKGITFDLAAPLDISSASLQRNIGSMTDSTDIVRRSTILIVDDEPANVSLLERILKREDFTALISTTEPREALRLFREHPVDLVLLDLMMPDLDGFALLETFARLIPENSYLPILVLTADATLPTRRRALSLGARDFLTKPFDAIEAILRIFNLLETRILTLELAKHGLATPKSERPRID